MPDRSELQTAGAARLKQREAKVYSANTRNGQQVSVREA